jgi:predicted amidophosphoribosyltransferase
MLAGISGSLSSLMGLLQGADAGPTSQALAAVTERRQALSDLMGKWKVLKAQDLANLNAQLKAANLPAIEIKD